MIRRPPRSTLSASSAASDVYKRQVYTILMISALCTSSLTNYRGEEKHDIGTLAGDVQNWAMLIQNYILQVSSVYFTLLIFFIKSFGSGFIVYAVEITYYHNRAGRVQS